MDNLMRGCKKIKRYKWKVLFSLSVYLAGWLVQFHLFLLAMVSGYMIPQIDPLCECFITMVAFDFQIWIVNTHMLIEIR